MGLPHPFRSRPLQQIKRSGNFWSSVFWQGRLAYTPPDVVVYQGAIDSICGWTNGGPASYCSVSNTVYVDEAWYFATVAEIGDFAWVIILAHEYGHHVQYHLAENRIALPPPFRGTTGEELGADCLAGVYAQDAQTRGVLQTGDIAEALSISIIAGGIGHGSGDDRATAFMVGYLDGLYGCGVTL